MTPHTRCLAESVNDVGYTYLVTGAAAIAPGIVGAVATIVTPAVSLSWLRP